MSTFGQKLRYLRKARGWSQDQLGERLQTTKQVISRYESGARLPKIDFVSRLGNVLNVPFSFILNDSVDFVLWEDDCYEDYLRTNTDEDKVKMVNQWGLDVRIASDYANVVKRIKEEDCKSSSLNLLDMSEMQEAEIDLVSSFRELNKEGQEKVTEYMEDLISSGRYKKCNQCKLVEEA